MALIQEVEPPSRSNDQGSAQSKFFGSFQKYIQSITKQLTKVDFFAIIKQKFTKLSALVWIIFSQFKRLPISQYLPHVVMVFFVMIVFGSNINDRVMANLYANSLVEITPDNEIAIVSDIGGYTPLIVDGYQNIEKALSVGTTTDGFAIKTAAVETNITLREEPLPDNTSDTIQYAVKNGDNLTTIGWLFGVKLATIKYLNNIDNADSIKPGSTLKIPPKGYEVSTDLIAKKEQEKNAKQLALQNSRNIVTRAQASSRSKGTAPGSVEYSLGSRSNAYPYGYCTYYVATRRQVPSSWGDAKRWLGSAQNAGYKTGSTPVAGAIMVSSESWWGHVAFVESVNDDEFTVAEMNYKGWGIISHRTISVNNGVVRGFIY